MGGHVLIFSTAILVLVAGFLAYKLFMTKRDLKRFQGIMDIEEFINDATKESVSLVKQNSEAKATLEQLTKDIGVFTENIDLISAGFYKSKFDFENSDSYERKLEEIRDTQKRMIKEKSAITCSTEWTVSGSKAEGRKMTERTIKLGLSAFNVQCDNEILKVKFGSIERSLQKIEKLREIVDKLLEPSHCSISRKFYLLKIEELQLCYEYAEKLQKEKDEQKALREQMREEERARRESEKAQADAEREEKKYSEALEKARSEISNKSEKDKAKMLLRIEELEARLSNAIENKERAKSMAEQTRRGHVYIISNIGSFGEGVYKIGMTRRLDPNDRVDELSDASVPFDFDIHAMIPSEDAPNLERKLHDKFSALRMNKINERKEFFRVDIEAIKLACSDLHSGELRFSLAAEAKEYRQTSALNSTKAA